MSILSRVSSKTGQLLAGSVFDVEFDIEMWGGKGVDVSVFPSDGDFPRPGYPNGTEDNNSPRRKGGLGGYTKLTMIVPSNYDLQIRPYYYAGGQWGGGHASGFGIDNQWLAVVGGGGGAGFASLYRYRDPNRGLQFFSTQPGGNGSGGYGTGTPDNGENGSSCYGYEPYEYDERGNLVLTYIGSRLTAGGGGGAPRGLANGVEPCKGLWHEPGGSGNGGSGGGGNIRIYKDQSILDGYLNIFPDVKMTYVTHSDGVSTSARVRVTNKKTGNFTDYTSNIDIKALEISKI